MHIAGWRGLLGQALVILAISACSLAGCAPLIGYPKDPENTDATLAALAPYFNGVKEADYLATADLALRTAKRNAIVLARLRGYDIEFYDFEQELYGQGNEITLGADLTALALGGLIATTGKAATKSALGAASAGVIGAKAAIDKDLFYQKTIPALLAQMEADRLKAILPITAGMKFSDAEYPLMQAYIDLDAYKNAGSIPAAINQINKAAGNAKDTLQALRSTAFLEDTSSQRLRTYIWPSGITNLADQTHVEKLRQWMSTHQLAGVPVAVLLNSAALAEQRKQAVIDLSVP
jgi:hypothetical protein